jgi:DNA-binding CsgD family transcriptional regulator
MASEEIAKLVRGTADPAFAIDCSGLVSAWNVAAEDLFGLSSIEAIGAVCHDILQGADEGGVTCSVRCAIQQALEVNRPVENFDLQIQTKTGRQWCNISILIVSESRSGARHAVHIIHPREMRKRFEQLIRDFLVSQTDLSPEVASQLVNKVRLATRNVRLTPRETEILSLLANGIRTRTIAGKLGISEKTVNNHVNRLLTKLDAHNRLEAIRRAEKAGLIRT